MFCSTRKCKCIGKNFLEEQRFDLPGRDSNQALATVNPYASKSRPSKGEINPFLRASVHHLGKMLSQEELFMV